MLMPCDKIGWLQRHAYSLKKKTFLTASLHMRYSHKLFMRYGNKHNGKFNKQITILMSSRKRQAFWPLHRGNMNMLLGLGGKLNEPCVDVSVTDAGAPFPAVLHPCIINLHAISCSNILFGNRSPATTFINQFK